MNSRFPIFPMSMTLRCYACGKAFEVLLVDKHSRGYPCPACGKVEVFGLGEWEKMATVWNEKNFKKMRGRL
jgi:predicted RNA-binding Zn-ribbon protein involved in translation (DUF1610 family)